MSAAKVRPRGRPRTGRGTRVMVTLPTDASDAVRKEAARIGMPVAVYCRVVIMRAVAVEGR